MKLVGLFNRPASVFYEAYRRQLAATLTVNIITFSHGIGFGWAAPMLLKLQSNDSPLMFHISVHEASWIGSVISIGAMIGIAGFGVLIDEIGRKTCVSLLAVPHTCFWVMVFFTSNVSHLYIARFLGGITAGAIYVVIPLFVSEIADSSIRGTLNSLFWFSINIGIMVGFIIGAHVPYLLIPCIIVVLPILYLLLWTMFPETPHQLLRKERTDEAENSLKFYTNYKDTGTENCQKFASDFSELKISIESIKGTQRLSIRDFCNKRSLKAIGIGVTLVFVNVCSGTLCIISYSSMIFAETKSTIDPNTNTIIIGAVQILGSYCATILVDKYGRKILMLVSTFGMCFGLTVIGVYSYLVHHTDLRSVSWLPVVVISFVIFTANIGVVAVTFVILVEILPAKIRSLGSTFCLLVMSVFFFVLLKAFPILMVAIGLWGVMWICAGVAAFGFVFSLICLRETKGKSLYNDSTEDEVVIPNK